MKYFSNLVLAFIILLAFTSLSFSQSKVSIAVKQQFSSNIDTFYFQKFRPNTLNIGMSNNVSSFFIGNNAGTNSSLQDNIGIGKNALSKLSNGI